MRRHVSAAARQHAPNICSIAEEALLPCAMLVGSFYAGSVAISSDILIRII